MYNSVYMHLFHWNNNLEKTHYYRGDRMYARIEVRSADQLDDILGKDWDRSFGADGMVSKEVIFRTKEEIEDLIAKRKAAKDFKDPIPCTFTLLYCIHTRRIRFYLDSVDKAQQRRIQRYNLGPSNPQQRARWESQRAAEAQLEDCMRDWFSKGRK